jgi:thiamine pyrophosphate-dependent acetolactate synthase large subunit-like protein
MKGYEAITCLKEFLTDKDLLVSSNGNISREVYHLLPKPQIYLRGSMGLPVGVGLGLAIMNPDKRVTVITGDGNLLMGFGSLTTTAYYHPKNLRILILDNTQYYTTGGQKTVSTAINYNKFFDSLNIKNFKSLDPTENKIKEILSEFLNTDELSVLHLTIEEGKQDLVNIPWHPIQITEEVQQDFT